MTAALQETVASLKGVTWGAPQDNGRLTTGIDGLDAALGGGIPRGRIMEIYGNEGSGKTALALHIADQIQGPVLYLDGENGLPPVMPSNPDIYLARPETLEDAFDMVRMAAPAFEAVVIDTVASLPTRGETYPASRVMSRCLPRLVGTLQAHGCTLFLVTQMRDRPGCLYGDPNQHVGGKAIEYFAALRLEVRKREHIRGRDHTITGQVSEVLVRKSKFSVPGRSVSFVISYMKGVA